MITLGADHRAVRMGMSTPIASNGKDSRCRRRDALLQPSLKRWEPSDAHMYSDLVDERLREIHLPTASCDQRCKAIEDTLVEVGRRCAAWAHQYDEGGNVSKEHLHSLIGERRAARSAGLTLKATAASKLIQKEIRAIARARKLAKISNILEEFRGLRFINGARAT